MYTLVVTMNWNRFRKIFRIRFCIFYNRSELSHCLQPCKIFCLFWMYFENTNGPSGSDKFKSHWCWPIWPEMTFDLSMWHWLYSSLSYGRSHIIPIAQIWWPTSQLTLILYFQLTFESWPWYVTSNVTITILFLYCTGLIATGIQCFKWDQFQITSSIHRWPQTDKRTDSQHFIIQVATTPLVWTIFLFLLLSKRTVYHCCLWFVNYYWATSFDTHYTPLWKIYKKSPTEGVWISHGLAHL